MFIKTSYLTPSTCFKKCNMAKRTEEECPQFCGLPRKSIKLLAESVGISCLSSEAAGALAEDVTYRIRQIIQNAICFVKHSKRDNLTGEDINRTLFWSHVEPIYGYGSKSSNVFSSIPMRDGDIFFHEDKEVNLRELTFSKGLSSLDELGDGDSKICVELTLLNEETSKNEPSTGECPNPSTREWCRNFDSLSDVLKSYYHQITRNIMNGDTDTVKVVLTDLKDNPKVQIFLPYLMHFITTGIKLLSGDLEKLLRLFALVKTLVDNKNLYLEPYVVQFVRAVMYCLVGKPASQTTGTFDEWILRETASKILYHIDRKCSNSSNYLHHQLLRTLKDIYEDNEQPLFAQYGAVISLSMLGIEAVEQTILPHFKTFAEHLETSQKANLAETVTERLYLVDALKGGVLSFFRNKLRTLATISTKDHAGFPKINKNPPQASSEAEISSKANFMESSKSDKDIAEWYKDVYQFFGDSFSLLTGNLEDFKSIVQCKMLPPHSSNNVFSRYRGNRQSTIQTRNLIQRVRESKPHRGTDSGFVSAFSLPPKRRRFNDETEDTSCALDTKHDAGRITSRLKYKALDNDDSEVRFEHLIKKSFACRRESLDWKNHVGKCKCYGARRTLSRKRKLLTSLSVFL